MNKKKYKNNPLIAFWEWGKRSATPPAPKLPKSFRKKGSLGLRVLKTIKINKKTGEYYKV